MRSAKSAARILSRERKFVGHRSVLCRERKFVGHRSVLCRERKLAEMSWAFRQGRLALATGSLL